MHASLLTVSHVFVVAAQTCGDYVSRAAKVVTLVDLAGHEKYFRTTAYGLTGAWPVGVRNVSRRCQKGGTFVGARMMT